MGGEGFSAPSAETARGLNTAAAETARVVLKANSRRESSRATGAKGSFMREMGSETVPPTEKMRGREVRSHPAMGAWDQKPPLRTAGRQSCRKRSTLLRRAEMATARAPI